VIPQPQSGKPAEAVKEATDMPNRSFAEDLRDLTTPHAMTIPVTVGKSVAAGNDMRFLRHVEEAFQIASGLHNEGKLPEADKLYQFILAVMPTHYDSLFRLGTLRARSHQMNDAVHLLSRAVSAKPDRADALGGLGVALSALDRDDEAITCYQKALSINPNHAAVLNALGTVLHKRGQTDQAIEHFQRAIAISPDCSQAHFTLAGILQGLDRLGEAIIHYGKVLTTEPRNYAVHNNLGAILQKLGRFEEAINHYKLALAINPDYVDAYCNLGNALFFLNRTEDSIVENEKALRLDPCKVAAHNNLGVAFQALGRMEDARGAYERALQIAPRNAAIHLNLAYLRRFTAGDRRLTALEKLAEDVATLSAEDQISLHFALGRAYGDLGQHERSFRHLRDGNALKRAMLAYQEKEVLSLLERIRTTFTPELMQQKSGAGHQSDMPVFVVGMPRSGTTLVEQILASHSKVYGAGEIETFYRAMVRFKSRNGIAAEFPDVVQAMSPEALCGLGSEYVQWIRSAAPAAERIVNKLPLNFKYVGLIHLALPQARIIHVCRDPLDTCLSCFSMLFTGAQSFSYDLGELGRYYRGYAAVMDHWRSVLPPGVMIEVQYEDLIADLEGQASAIVDHCGLPWEDSCLAFHQTKREVKTASSVQVRDPLYRTSVGRWRPYESFLQPLIQALNGEASVSAMPAAQAAISSTVARSAEC
jgi:tetratricopeptide (TPR) repeat protein